MWPRDGIVVPCRCRRALWRCLWQQIDISTDGGRSDQDSGRGTQGAGQPGSQAEARTVGVDQDPCDGRSEGKPASPEFVQVRPSVTLRAGTKPG